MTNNGSLVADYSAFVDYTTAPDKFADIDLSAVAPEEREWIDASDLRVLHRALSGLLIEAGEANRLVHKAVYRGHDLDHRQLALELGDAMWYLTMACNALHITLDELLQLNITKLRSRYPDGYNIEDDHDRKKGKK